MTREEAIEEIKDASDGEIRHGDYEHHPDLIERRVEAFFMAIQALSQESQCTEHPCLGTLCRYYKEPCDDAISRQSVINEIENDCMRGGLGSCFASYDDAQKFRGEIEQLPSVTQKPNFCASCKHNTDNEICLEYEYDGITRGMTRYESVTQKSGRWVDSSNGWMCSACNKDNTYDTNYCPNCGAKMESEE